MKRQLLNQTLALAKLAGKAVECVNGTLEGATSNDYAILQLTPPGTQRACFAASYDPVKRLLSLIQVTRDDTLINHFRIDRTEPVFWVMISHGKWRWPQSHTVQLILIKYEADHQKFFTLRTGSCTLLRLGGARLLTGISPSSRERRPCTLKDGHRLSLNPVI